MVRPSAQQTIDRVVGTAVVIGLSIAATRWLSHNSKQRLSGQKQLPWWWPVIALRRRNGRHARSKCCHEVCKEDLEQCCARKMNTEGGYEHRGSCHCRSIHFLLRGPQKLHAIDSPGKIRYPNVPTTASRFQLLRGESNMKFYYSFMAESNIASEEPGYNFENDDDINDRKQQQSAEAHGFCGNCGVHILRAPSRRSEDLEINANCFEDVETSLSADGKVGNVATLHRFSSYSLTSNNAGCEVDNTTFHDREKMGSDLIETVDENEALLGGCANFCESLDDRPPPPKPRISKFTATETENKSDCIYGAQPFAQSVTESDDYSMGSYSSLHMLSVASGGAVMSSSNNIAGLPPLPPSSGISAKTLPPRFGQLQQMGHSAGRSGGPGINSNWSIASMGLNDLYTDVEKSSVVTPKMMNQMKYYMSRHMAKEK